MKYSHLVLGGTFDLLHLGHQSFLNEAFKLCKFVTIGLTTDKFNVRRGKPSFQNQDERIHSLKTYLETKKYAKRCRIVWINDKFGTTLKDSTLEAIIVTKTSQKVAKLINSEREKKGLKKLDIKIAPFVKGEDGETVSSSRIRQGEINTSGQSYKDLLLKIAGKKLSEAARTKLKKPLGPLISPLTPPNPSNSPNPPYITVGDATTAKFLKAGLSPNLAIIDGKVGRKNVFMDPRPSGLSLRVEDLRGDDKVVKNPPGQISKKLILTIDKTLKTIIHYSLFIILINGEEDLATIPAILLSPLGTYIYYGQPNQGLVEVRVDLKIKDYLCKILKL